MTSSHRQILRSSAIIGSASVIGILLGIVRLRIAAGAVGPVGIGVIGLLQNFVMLAGTLAAMGLGGGGARQIAAAWGEGRGTELADAKRTLWSAGALLAVLGGLAAWLVAAHGARLLSAAAALAGHAPWLGLAAALSVVGAVQMGVLTGARRLGDIARVNIIAGILATIVTAFAFPLWPERAIIVFVVAAPLLSVLVGQYYVTRSDPLPKGGSLSFAQLRIMLAIGLGMTTSAVLSLASALFVRGLVQERLGDLALGYFQAAWAIASMYLGLVLHAMATDYLPRLSQVAGDEARLTRLVNEQAEVLVLLGGPIIVGMIGAAPLVVLLLYGGEFAPAVGLLRLQLLGDVFKLLGWPLGYVLLAIAASRRFVVNEVLVITSFPLLSLLLIDWGDLSAVGWAYGLMFLFGLLLSQVAVLGRLPGFRWDRPVLADAGLTLAAAGLMWLLAPDGVLASSLVGASAAAVMAWWSYRRLSLHFPELAAALRGKLRRPAR